MTNDVGRDNELHEQDTAGLQQEAAGVPGDEVTTDFDREPSLGDAEWTHTHEKALIFCVRRILALSGRAYSEGAIRDLPDDRDDSFTPRSAVQALVNSGFKSSIGPLNQEDITQAICPAIIFKSGGVPVVLTSVNEEGMALISGNADDEVEDIEISTQDLIETLEPYVLLAKKLDSASQVKGSNDWFWGSMAQGKWLYGQVMLGAALTNILGLSTSLFIMVVYDRVVPNEAVESLIALTIGVLVALVFDFLIKTLRAHFVDTAGRRADGRMARLIFEKILAMQPDKKKQNAGAMASIVREFDTLREFFTSATIIAVVDLPFVFFFIWVISIIAGPLALVPLIAVPLVIACGLAIQPFLARITEGSMKSGMSKQGALIETLSGLETIQATGSGHLMRKRFEEASDSQSELGLRSRMLSQFAINSAASIQQLAQIATIFFGVFLIQDGVVTMGALIAAVILGGRTLAPLSQLASALTRANSARHAYRSLSSIMREDESNDDTPTTRLSRPQLRGVIEFKNVSYQFPGANAPVIRDLTFKVPAGQKVAIVGRMGSGKSTLMRLMAGLVNPTSGAILIDGVDIRQIDRSDLRRNVGVMLQETWLFSGSVKENLQMGFYEYEDAHLLNIARVSGVDDFVSGHPQGYDLELRERGEGLSGGQRQSINLARALLHSPDTLILDEPTSSMDTATEQAVISRLRTWGDGKTMVMVTHRNTLMELVDRVLVIDGGAVVADTTPEQIRKQSRG
ncbi:type I secretion system permease/ATPase [Rhodobacteraceae bacterium XHP0102]|nr:type I secretion system permease/ATPase [Rhodobacteraceae bacterium XHP0102]